MKLVPVLLDQLLTKITMCYSVTFNDKFCSIDSFRKLVPYFLNQSLNKITICYSVSFNDKFCFMDSSVLFKGRRSVLTAISLWLIWLLELSSRSQFCKSYYSCLYFSDFFRGTNDTLYCTRNLTKEPQVFFPAIL